jgi:carbon monoxide dehydrogenase subunit G
MQFENSFHVPLPPADAWQVLMNIERIAPCMPGAELTGKVDDRTYKGKVGVKLGPVALSFAGTANFIEIDEAGHRAGVKASGTDQKGRGGANAITTFRVESAAGGSRVIVATDLNLSGTVAQYGRGAGMIQEVARQLIDEFAANLRRQLAATDTGGSASATIEAAPGVPKPARPISGLSLFARALWSLVQRLLGLRASTDDR